MSKKFIIAHSVEPEGSSETHYGYTGTVNSKKQVIAEIPDDLAEIELAAGRVQAYEEIKEPKAPKEPKEPKVSKVDELGTTVKTVVSV